MAYSGRPQQHRRVTAADSADPAITEGVTTEGWDGVVFWIDIAASALTAVSVTPVWLDNDENKWYGGDGWAQNATGKYIFRVPGYGKKVFLKVDTVTGTSVVVNIRSSVYREHH